MVGQSKMRHTLDKPYFIELRYARRRIVVKWYSDDIDHVAQKFGRVIDYGSGADAICDSYNANAAIKSLASSKPNWSLLINIVNLLEDMGYTKHRIPVDLYNKIFYGCNLPAIKKDGPKYIPTLSKIERNRVVQFISKNSLSVIKESIKTEQ
jgi:hypothetical protein